MSNDLVAAAGAGGLAALMDSNYNPYAEFAEEHAVQSGQYLTHSGNTGKWRKTGNVDVEDGTVFAFNLFEAMHGWVLWKDNKPIDEKLVLIRSGQKAPAITDLPDPGPKIKETDGWKQVVRVPVRDLAGGDQMDITDKADGGRRPILVLLKQFGEKWKLNIDVTNQQPRIPLVKIGSRSFDSKAGTKYAPTYEIEGWMSEAELVELMGSSEPPAAADPVAAAAASMQEVIPPKAVAPVQQGAKPGVAGRRL